jgi:hypothetical protein
MDAAGNPIQTQNPQQTLNDLLLTIEQIYGANTNNGAAGGGEPTASPEQPAANPAIASLKAQIDKLDPASKKQLLTTLQT